MKKTLHPKLPKTPLLAVDCVVMDAKKNVLLIRRKNRPFKGSLALPGGFVDWGENVEEACRREVLEETGIAIKDLRLIGIYSDPDRDPRGHVCSIAFKSRILKKIGKANDDASDVVWTNSWQKLKLAFDHNKIISDSIDLKLS